MAKNFLSADYNIREGKYHKGGSAHVQVMPETSQFMVKLNFDITKRALVPVPSSYLQGEYTIELPNDFRDERGYLELEHRKTMKVNKATLKYLGRACAGGYNDAHKFEIITDNGKSRTEVIYHPSLPGTGWFSVNIKLISSIALLNGYELIADLKN